MDNNTRNATYDEQAKLREDDAVRARAKEIAGELMGELEKHPERYEKHDLEFWTAFYVANFSEQIKEQLKQETQQKEQAQDARDARISKVEDEFLDALDPSKLGERLSNLVEKAEQFARELGGLSLRGQRAGNPPLHSKGHHAKQHAVLHKDSMAAKREEESGQEMRPASRPTPGGSRL